MEDDKRSSRKGIFSTPDLSVDAQKIAPDTTPENPSTRAVSFFADTNTTKQFQQGSTADTTQDKKSRRHNKAPAIIVLIIIILIAVGVVISILNSVYMS